MTDAAIVRSHIIIKTKAYAGRLPKMIIGFHWFSVGASRERGKIGGFR